MNASRVADGGINNIENDGISPRRGRSHLIPLFIYNLLFFGTLDLVLAAASAASLAAQSLRYNGFSVSSRKIVIPRLSTFSGPSEPFLAS
jgi:hypothetical protein